MLFLSNTLVTSFAITRTSLPKITNAITAVSDAVSAQNAVIGKFPDSATFADFDTAGDSLTDALQDLAKTIDKSKSLSRSDSNEVVSQLVIVIPKITHTLMLVVKKKPAFVEYKQGVKEGETAADHVKEELTSDQADAKKVFDALQKKLVITDPRKLLKLAQDLEDEFKKAVAAYE